VIARAHEKGGRDCGAIIAHLATYGCRPVDACRLRVRDFNAVAGTLTLGAAAGRRLKNGGKATHPLLPVHVELYRTLISDRAPDEPLFLSHACDAWAVGKSAGQLLDWYTANVSEHLLPRPQWGLYCLKDYAISTMDRDGIDDRTKALFTGHRSLAVFERYKTTNQERAGAALDRMRPAGERATDPTAPALRPDGRTSD
nr:hypothetical protein [Betaproteobacteria bacterium]